MPPKQKKDGDPKDKSRGDGGGKGDGPKKDTLNRQEMAANYGFAMAFLKSDDELWKLFKQATRKTWTSQMFVAKLRSTKWFQKNSATVRNAIMQETADPATYKQNVQQMLATVKDTWGKTFGDDIGSPKQLKAWAETAVRMGWSEAQLMDHMSKGLNYQRLLTKNRLGGTAAQISGQLDQLTSAYGLQYGNQWKGRQLEKIIRGDDTLEGIQDRLRGQAMNEYAAFADRIQGGETVADIAEPYIQQMADLLEINPYELNVRDKMIQSALKRKDDKGKPAALDLASFADMVRKDARWQYTDNAKQQVSGVLSGLFKNWGVTA